LLPHHHSSVSVDASPRPSRDVARNAPRPGSTRAARPSGAGFTLLELLVVIVIIGLLAGLVAPRYFDQVSKSNTKIAKAQIDSLETALDEYRLDPWGASYIYQSPGEHGEYDLLSYGKDGQPGGSGEAADVTSW